MGKKNTLDAFVRKKRSNSEELERRLDSKVDQLTAEDLEAVVDDISDDEGKDGGDVSALHREIMNKQDDENLKRLENDIRNHDLVRAAGRRRKGGRVLNVLSDDSGDEDTDEEDEMAKQERYRNIDEQRREQVLQSGQTEGETIEEIDQEAVQREQFLQLKKLEKTRNKHKTKMAQAKCFTAGAHEEKRVDLLRCIRKKKKPSNITKPGSEASRTILTKSVSSFLGRRTFGGNVKKGGQMASSHASGTSTVSSQYIFSISKESTSESSTSGQGAGKTKVRGHVKACRVLNEPKPIPKKRRKLTALF
mmetsp:Transcript_24958/g.40493  ORF Transcript_24958/g.40493 Transcript_24958/m.40493 type:complete len:306 (-) Transcript_24958:1084-2001(-)